MEYHKIGERFEFNGVVLEVIESRYCKNCFFLGKHGCILESPMYCGSNTRADNTCISYKLVEQCKSKDMEQKEVIEEKSDERLAILDKESNRHVFVQGKFNDEDLYESFLDKLFTTYKAKDKDYGSAFSEMFDELGIDYAYGKLREKINRIKVLRNQPNMVENEGLEDALLDTAGYAILTLVELKKRKQ